MGVNLSVERLRRLHSWMNGVPAPPLRMSIFPTNVCNLRCKMCGVSAAVRAGKFKVTDELTDEEWLCIIRDGAQMGILEWWVGGGGEPLVRGDLTLNILKTIKRLSPPSEIELTTNGSRLTEDFLREIVDLGLDKIQLSLDFPDARTHDLIRGRTGTFDTIIWAARMLNQLKEEKRTHRPWLTTNTILSALNYNRLDEMVELAASVGIEQVNVTPLRIVESLRSQMGKAGLLMNEGQKRAAFSHAERARRLAGKHGIQFRFLVNRDWEDISEKSLARKRKSGKQVGPQETRDDACPQFLNLRCYETWYTLAIDAQGNPGPCVTGAIGDPDFNLRNRTLHDLWYGEYFMRIRSHLIENRLIGPCSHCTVTDLREGTGRDLREYARLTSHPAP